MNTPIILNHVNAFRSNGPWAEARCEAKDAQQGSFHPDAAASAGGLSRQELRDLVLHWMG